MIVKRNTLKFEIVDLLHGLFNIGWMLQARCGDNVTDYFEFTLSDPFKVKRVKTLTDFKRHNINYFDTDSMAMDAWKREVQSDYWENPTRANRKERDRVWNMT